MSDLAIPPADQSPAVVTEVSRNRRLLALTVVLLVSLSGFVATSFHSLFLGAASVDPSNRQFRLAIALITEGTSLLLLWFVLSGQGRSWKDIGLVPRWSDVLPGIGLIIATKIAAYAVNLQFQLLYRAHSGHYLQPRNIHGIFGSGISVLTVILVLVNPIFEELIVRAYLMSEIIGLGRSRATAILASVIVQVSYHTYQGVLRCIAVATAFTLLSVYFSRTRKIGPAIVAHFYSDVSALIRASF